MSAASSSLPGSGTVSPSGRTSKRRANNDLLRNYYGLGADESVPSTPPPLPSPTVATAASTTDPDSTKFDVDAAFQLALQRKSLAQLLKEESDLLTDIRELDGERQSLVYNHHHELVSASETMRKMKERADLLLPSLTSLQKSLQSISKTSEALVASPHAQVSQRRDSVEDALRRAQPAIKLPQQLRDLILLDGGQNGLAKAQSLWGTMESVLASWDEAGIKGAKDIMHNCRTVLREAQQRGVEA